MATIPARFEGFTFTFAAQPVPAGGRTFGPFACRAGRRTIGRRRVSIRLAGRMHHLGIGRRHAGKHILAITDETTITLIHLDTGEILSEHQINPTRGYWRNLLTPPGRWPQK